MGSARRAAPQGHQADGFMDASPAGSTDRLIWHVAGADISAPSIRRVL